MTQKSRIGVRVELSQGNEKKVSELKPGMDNLSLKVRVISAEEPKVITTRRGPRTISNAVVGDETGRVKVTLWGDKAGTLKEGQAVEIQGAWTTAYRGEVQVNVGFKGDIKEVENEEVPEAENVPEETPKAPEDYRPSYRRSYRRSSRRRY